MFDQLGRDHLSQTGRTELLLLATLVVAALVAITTIMWHATSPLPAARTARSAHALPHRAGTVPDRTHIQIRMYRSAAGR